MASRLLQFCDFSHKESRRGPIKKLDMNEGMTMVFRAQDPAMLKQVKVGDKVRFNADRINGQITVTKIEKAK
jgi:Cu(I)/Ag(I) efflux system periplasmic protein CusF